MCLSNTPFILLLLLFLGYLNFIFFSSFIAVGAFNFLMASIWCILLLLRVLLLLLLLPDSSSFSSHLILHHCMLENINTIFVVCCVGQQNTVAQSSIFR